MAALAAALEAEGIDASVVALSDYAELVRGLGVRFVPIQASIEGAVARTRTRVGRVAISGLGGQAVMLHHWIDDIAPLVAEAVLGEVGPGDTVVTGIFLREVASALATARSCQIATLLHTAMLPTRHRQSHFMRRHFTGVPALDRLGADLWWTLTSTLGRAAAREVRDRAGLARSPRRRAATAQADAHPIIVAASRTLVTAAPDWPWTAYQTGHLAAPSRPFTPDADLETFLTAGPTPVYVGFGSAAGTVGHRNLDRIVAAAALSRRRVITPALGGTAPGQVDERVFAVGDLPHDWLFPQLAGVVHHGGAGTSYAALRAGVPSVALPLGFDQSFHALRLRALRVGPAPVPMRLITSGGLSRLLTQLSGPAYRRTAAQLGRLTRAEDGVGDTVRLLCEFGLAPRRSSLTVA